MDRRYNIASPASQMQGQDIENMKDVSKTQPIQETSSEHMGVFDPTKTLNQQANLKIDVKNTNFFYVAKQALYGVSIPIRERQATALIGPSGCGRSTFLRSLNRM